MCLFPKKKNLEEHIKMLSDYLWVVGLLRLALSFLYQFRLGIF